MGLHDQPAEGIGRDGTTRMEQAAMPDFHEAIGQDGLEEPAEQLQDVEGGVRRRALPTFREVQVTVRSLSETMRLLERAPLKTEGARAGKAEWPL
jgi:hypothetical protein